MEKCLGSTEDKNDSLSKTKNHSIIHVTITLKNKNAYLYNHDTQYYLIYFKLELPLNASSRKK